MRMLEGLMSDEMRGQFIESNKGTELSIEGLSGDERMNQHGL